MSSCKQVTFPVQPPIALYRTPYDIAQINKFNTCKIPDNIGNFGQGGIRGGEGSKEGYCGPRQGGRKPHRTLAYDDPNNFASYGINY